MTGFSDLAADLTFAAYEDERGLPANIIVLRDSTDAIDVPVEIKESDVLFIVGVT